MAAERTPGNVVEVYLDGKKYSAMLVVILILKQSITIGDLFTMTVSMSRYH